ncbi:MAG TPA: hypothetical protein DDW52_16685 [Planctomycetaceae bacterium]|nr:hypothetical protein [Planctomycetaceae bacterium]
MSRDFTIGQLDVPHRALIIGENSLSSALSSILDTKDIVHSSCKSLDDGLPVGTTAIFHTWFPNPDQDSPQALAIYPQKLLEHSLASAATLTANHPTAAIVSFCFLPAMYVGTALEDHTSNLRGGVTGVTRTLCRKFGKQGLRTACVQGGLIDMPEVDGWVSEAVKTVEVPTKRWATAQEVAKFMFFLGIQSTYTTGQTMVIDGGLTSGITGT